MIHHGPPIFASVKITSLGTLASRLLGLARDMATGSLLGLSGGVLDALVLAFRVPNLFRGLFGEGALATSLVPLLSARLEHDRQAAWQLVTAVLLWLSALLAIVVLVAEAVLFLLGRMWSSQPERLMAVELSALVLPYLLLVCLSAQVAATLQALSRFALPALAPALLNVVWLLAVWLVAPHVADRAAQARVIAGAILLAGLLQLAVQLPALFRLGFRPRLETDAGWQSIRQVMRSVGPTMLALGVGRFNALLGTLIAYLLAAPAGMPLQWLGGVRAPLEPGALSALYFGERMYQLPLGLLGVAVATVIFPLLSRHAARGDRRRAAADLTAGLRLALLLGIPASAGLILLAEPAARLLFERGEFTASDTARTARVIAAYAVGVWAFCGLPIVLRGYYALGDRRTPLRIGGAVVAVNLVLNLALIWPLAEVGLALAASLSAALQWGWLVGDYSARYGPIAWRPLVATLARSSAATAVMLGLGHALLRGLPDSANRYTQAAGMLVVLAVCLAAFWLVSRRLGDADLYAQAGL
jgi:putative peptidoglycan lipid II flippase